MGIISDYFEDTTEKIGQFRDAREHHGQSKKKTLKVEPQPILVSCPLCGQKLLSDDHLDRHILTTHANRRVYLRSGSEVLRTFEIFDEAPAILKAVLLGPEKATITIHQSEWPAQKLEVRKEIDLIEYLHKPILGLIRVNIDFKDGSREYTLIVGKTGDFNHEEVDRYALKSLFLPLHNGETPEWSDFAEKFLVPRTNPLEYQYAAGFYDYTLGFHLFSNQSKDHLETALGILSSFSTHFAITACRVLATRMNCFKLLESCKPSSRFYVVNLFFNEPSARYGYKVKPTDQNWSNQEYGVFIDDFTEIYLGALNAYYAGDFSSLAELVLRLQSMTPDEDKNNRDKLIILYARTAARKDGKKSASKYYEIIRHHPDFGEEAREMLQ